jgi:NADH-quinone oxidoreductase subunit C
MKDAQEAASRIQEAFPDAVEEVSTFRGQTVVVLRKEALLDAANFLKKEPDLAFDFLTMVCGVDYHPREPRFEVVYQLYSTQHCHRLRLKVRLPSESPSVPTVTGIWPTADWHERETYDLMGIRFEGHPDLRRLFLPEGWEGHPLRKDYPLRGQEASNPIEDAG